MVWKNNGWMVVEKRWVSKRTLIYQKVCVKSRRANETISYMALWLGKTWQQIRKGFRVPESISGMISGTRIDIRNVISITLNLRNPQRFQISNIKWSLLWTLAPKPENVLSEIRSSFQICFSDIRKAFRICYDALPYSNLNVTKSKIQTFNTSPITALD